MAEVNVDLLAKLLTGVFSKHFDLICNFFSFCNFANFIPFHSVLSRKMYPSTLTQLARANPFSAPLFTLQHVDEPKQGNVQGRRRLAAAAVAGKIKLSI